MIPVLPIVLVAFTAVAPPATSRPVEQWEWAIAPTPSLATSWVATPNPYIEESWDTKNGSLWLRTRLQRSDAKEPEALFFGYNDKAFDVFVGDVRVHSFPGSPGVFPWHLVELPPEIATEPLYLRFPRPAIAGNVTGFGWGVRQGTRAGHYLWILQSEWKVAAIALLLLVLAVLAFAAHLFATMRRQSRPYLPLAALFAASGLWAIPQHAGYLASLVFPYQTVLDVVALVIGSCVPACELWYAQRVFQRSSLWLRALTWSFVVYGLVIGTALLGWNHSLDGWSYPYTVLTLVAAVSILVMVARAWRDLSRSMRVASVGLIIFELASILENASVFFGVVGEIWSPSYPGLLAFVGFIFLSLLIINAEARAQEDAERERHARTHAIAELTAMFAHDVRKPFGLVHTTLQSLEEAKSLDEVKTALELVKPELAETTHSVEEMISDILDSGRAQPVQTQPVELRELLKSALHVAAREGARCSATLKAELRHSQLLDVQRTQLTRVLVNLVSNALDAMGERGHLWIVSRDAVKGGRRWVEVTMGNSGPPILPELLPRIFEPFVSHKRSGTGLGLSIVKRLIEAHGGTIECHSGERTGVEFVFTLPCSKEPADTSIVLPLRLERAPRSAPSAAIEAVPLPYVVLVEDSPTVRHAWKKRLAPGTLRAFASPDECLQAAENNPSLLSHARFIILDVRFDTSDTDGIDLGGRIRGLTPAPILLCSGVPLAQLPSWCDGQLPKAAYTMEELQRMGSSRPQTVVA